MKKTLTLTAATLLCLACSPEHGGTEHLSPLAFSDPGTKSSLSSLYQDFRVWTSSVTTEASTVMAGYQVNHDPLTGWSYTRGEGTEGQELQFWNEAAESFRFHAGTPCSRVSSISESSLSLKVAQGYSISELALFTEPHIVLRDSPAYGEVVNLKFRFANARVNLAFRTTTGSAIEITGISLTPPAEYATEGTLRVDYDWSRGLCSCTLEEKTLTDNSPLPFPDISVTAGDDNLTETPQPLFVLPDPSFRGQWTLNAVVDGQPKSIPFTVDKGWESGNAYTYTFRYSEETNLIFEGTETVIFTGDDLEDGDIHHFE